MANTAFKEFLKEAERNKEYIKRIKDLLEEGQFGLLPLQQIFTIREGVTKETEFGYYSPVSNVTHKDEGCGKETKKLETQVRTGWFDPVPLKVIVSDCYSTLEKTFDAWVAKTGADRFNIDDSDYVAFLVSLIENGILNDFNRFVFFADKEHSVVGSGSGTQVLKAGLDKANFNVFNGLFSQFEKMVATATEKKIAIAENAKTSYADQRALADSRAYEVLCQLKDIAGFKAGASPVFVITQSLATNLTRFMRKEFRNEQSFKMVEGGYMVSEFEGVTVVTSEWLDDMIRSNFDNGTKWHNPHRALLLDKNECQIAIDSMGALKDIGVEYLGGKFEEVYLKASYRADFQRVIGNTGAMAI